jgi:hypothetical protein
MQTISKHEITRRLKTLKPLGGSAIVKAVLAPRQ